MAKKLVTIFELLDTKSFRKRSAMYLGEESISKLKLFMSGYELFENLNNIKTEDTKPPFQFFYNWICKYYHHTGSYFSWDGIILQNSNDDEKLALSTFFDRFDEYRKFKPICIQKCKLDDNKNELILIEYGEHFGTIIYHMNNQTCMNSIYYRSKKESIKSKEIELKKTLVWKEVSNENVNQIIARVQ